MCFLFDSVKRKLFPLRYEKIKVREPTGITASNFYREIRFTWLMISTYKRG